MELVYNASGDGERAITELAMVGVASEPIAHQLREHQQQLDDWYAEPIRDFQTWTERFVLEFNIGLEATPTFGVQRMRSMYAFYMPGRSEVGIRDNIRFNEGSLDRDPAEVYGTLLHELLHLEQQYHGKPGTRNYHNKEYRERALTCGLVVDRWGCHNGYTSVFTDVLCKYGVRLEPYVVAEREGRSATASAASALKTWRCDCTRVLSEGTLDARCLACGTAFTRAYRGSGTSHRSPTTNRHGRTEK